MSLIETVQNDPYIADRIKVYIPGQHRGDWEGQVRRQFHDLKAVESTQPREGKKDAGNGSHPWSHMEQRRPLIIQISNDQHSANLIFIDVSGEESVDEQGIARVSPHLAKADQLWFFITPNINRDIRRQLEIVFTAEGQAGTSMVRNELLQEEHITQEMIEQLASTWKRVARLRPDDPVGSPRLRVAVVVAKADLLTKVEYNDAFTQELVAKIAPPDGWSRGAHGASNLYSVTEIEKKSELVGELMFRLTPQVVRSVLSHFPEAMFLTVAATGSPARLEEDDDSLGKEVRVYENIRPFGIVDLFIQAANGTEVKVHD
ncbi:hypothetical protein [Dietzia sp. 2505]|uniref:hypothetical protein n=1 Tax=Dietzia sp. 2505 TaxID=3156457 RepID=UPI003398F5E8